MPSEKEYQRAVKIIEDSLLVDTGQKVRSIDVKDSFGNQTRLYTSTEGRIRGTLNAEKGENSIKTEKLDAAIETINQAALKGEIDVELPENPVALAVVLAWFGMGIFIGLMLAGVIYTLTV